MILRLRRRMLAAIATILAALRLRHAIDAASHGRRRVIT